MASLIYKASMVSLPVYHSYSWSMQYDKNCCLFLERMRLYSSYDLVQKFKSFVKDFVGILWETCSEAVHRSKLFLGKSS